MKQAKRQHLQIDSKAIKQEYRAILTRAKDIGKSRLMSSYCMGAYFIALNRNTTLSPEECYALYKDGLSANQLFHKVMGNADSYLNDLAHLGLVIQVSLRCRASAHPSPLKMPASFLR